MSMSELVRYTKTPKDQMTKMSNRLVEQGLAERVYDPADRRIIRLSLTDKAQSYIGHFVEHGTGCFKPLLTMLDEQDRDTFGQALESLAEIFFKLPCDPENADYHDTGLKCLNRK